VGTKSKRKALSRRKAVDRRFTVTRLATLAPGRYADPAQESLYLLVRAKAAGTSRTWVHRIKYRGGDTYLTVGHFPETSLAEARTIVQDERELLAKGIEPKRAKARRRVTPSPVAPSAASVGGPHTIENLVHEFMERHVRRKLKRPEDVQRMLDRDILTAEAWKGRDVRTITPREVIELLDGVVDRGSPVAANRLASKIGQMFRFGVAPRPSRILTRAAALPARRQGRAPGALPHRRRTQGAVHKPEGRDTFRAAVPCDYAVSAHGGSP